MTRRWEGESNRGMIIYRLALSDVRFGYKPLGGFGLFGRRRSTVIHYAPSAHLRILFGPRRNSLKLGIMNHTMMGSPASLPCSRPSPGTYIGSNCVHPQGFALPQACSFSQLSHSLAHSRATPVYRNHTTTLNGPNASPKESKKQKAQCLAGSSDFHRSRPSSPWSRGTMRPRT